MYAHQVESVAELHACGVSVVVAVGKLMIIAHQPAGDVAGLVGIAPLLGCRLVDLRQEIIDHLLDGVCAAESADQSRLFERVAGLFDLPHYDVTLTARQRPFGGVLRVSVGCQYLVHVKSWAVDVIEKEIAVVGGRWPIE